MHENKGAPYEVKGSHSARTGSLQPFAATTLPGCVSDPEETVPSNNPPVDGMGPGTLSACMPSMRGAVAPAMICRLVRGSRDVKGRLRKRTGLARFANFSPARGEW